MSQIVNAVRRGFYLDSVALMRLSRTIAALPGVVEAALMMGTPANKAILRDADLLAEAGEGAAGNDLIIGVKADGDGAAAAALAEAESLLDRPRTTTDTGAAARPHSLRGALHAMADASLALISVPGDFAVAEARAAIRAGLDVMIFSDNVPVGDERALKEEARGLARLVMGPDCGTAIVNGVPLAFANRVPRGDIGIVGASGTGMQEVSCLIAQAGRGISQAIGVGGRDLSREVGGITTLMAIDMLDADPQTRHIVLISKPPHPDVARVVLERVGTSAKPFTVCFLGARDLVLPANARAATTLRAAAQDAVGTAAGQGSAPLLVPPRRGAVIGLFSGGTLCAEAQLILLEAGRKVASNAPVPGAHRLAADGESADRLLDLGADEFTRGRPHPMIDPTVRDDMLRATLADRNVAAILLDLVIGYGAHEDPAGHVATILDGLQSAHPPVVASVTGTEDDPQVRSRQVAALERAGVLVAPSNAEAAMLAAAIARG